MAARTASWTLLIFAVCGLDQEYLDALLDIKANLNDPTGSLDEWSATNGATACDWTGVRCSGGQTTVLHLDLRNRQLSGSVPRIFTTLPHLEHVDLGMNDIASIEGTAGSARYLGILNLEHTLVEEVPSDIFDAPWLSDLLLKGSKLKTLPAISAANTRLMRLDLQDTQLEEIPTSINKLEELTYFSAANTPLGGRFPPLAQEDFVGFRFCDLRNTCVTSFAAHNDEITCQISLRPDCPSPTSSPTPRPSASPTQSPTPSPTRSPTKERVYIFVPTPADVLLGSPTATPVRLEPPSLLDAYTESPVGSGGGWWILGVVTFLLCLLGLAVRTIREHEEFSDAQRRSMEIVRTDLPLEQDYVSPYRSSSFVDDLVSEEEYGQLPFGNRASSSDEEESATPPTYGRAPPPLPPRPTLAQEQELRDVLVYSDLPATDEEELRSDSVPMVQEVLSYSSTTSSSSLSDSSEIRVKNE